MLQSDINHLSALKKIDNYIYKLEDKIGSGSFSQVFRGTDLNSNTTVAIKKVRVGEIKSKIAGRLLECEISNLKIVKHPNVIRCYDVHSSVNHCYIVMEYCQGGDLDRFCKMKYKFHEEEIEKIAYQIYQGLSYLSQNSIIHRDLKISNVLLKDGVCKIADFGFSIKSNKIFKDVHIGSPIYMSPEGLISNLYGPKTDVWSYGILLYELIHGTTPLAHCKSQDELQMQVLKPPVISKNVPSDLTKLIINCLKINEKERISIAEIGQSTYMQKLHKKFAFSTSEKDLTLTKFSTETSLSADYSSRTSNSF